MTNGDYETWAEEFEIYLRDELSIPAGINAWPDIAPGLVFELHRRQFASYILRRERDSGVFVDEAWAVSYARGIWPDATDDLTPEAGTDG